MKRIRPAPMGRAFRYQRRISHIEIALAEKASGNGHGDLATTAQEGATAKPAKKAVRRAPLKKAAKKTAAKKSAGKKPAKKK
jgi:large subunit ribosomal protein L22